jgi:enediyne biosynthesis protein E4
LVQPGFSYCSSSDPRAYFGLGQNRRYEAIEVRWPDGCVEAFPGGAADRQIELHQGKS